MKKVTLGVFEVGQTVRPRDEKGYGGNRRGKVVEVSGDRVRVLWEKQANGVIGKRTWMQKGRLVQVVEASDDRPAVGPGGWCLDTTE
jgi:hypothetical protein